jgi:hypothetical protein
MDHSAHEPGTVAECRECQVLAYEPGWYKSLREERVVGKRPDEVAIPEVDEPDPEVIVAEAPDPVTTVPQLEEDVASEDT